MATTSNPVFSNDVFASYEQVYGGTHAPSTTMTLNGAIGKTFVLLGILSATAIWSWTSASANDLSPAVLPVAGILGLVLGLITTFKPSVSPWTAPLYAAFEGVFLGALSCMIEKSGARGAYPGIAMQAVSMTCGTLFVMLFLYATGTIKVTQKLRAGIMTATGAIFLVYMAAIALSLFGVRVPFLRDFSPIGIGISCVIVGVAAFNLLLDFDFIEVGARNQAPKYMEWYGAFGLMVTLVWLYITILRLLRQIQGRSR